MSFLESLNGRYATRRMNDWLLKQNKVRRPKNDLVIEL